MLKNVVNSRFTVIETVYHHSTDTEPTSVEAKFVRFLRSDDQPYKRKCKAQEAWSLIDTGWVESPSLLSIVNEEGRFLQVNPTKEQREAIDAAVLEISFDGATAHMYVPPGETFRVSPLVRIHVRSRKGEAKYTVFAVPS
jgi:hypothetical protein